MAGKQTWVADDGTPVAKSILDHASQTESARNGGAWIGSVSRKGRRVYRAGGQAGNRQVVPAVPASGPPVAGQGLGGPG